MRELNVEEVEAISGAMGPEVGIPLVLGIMGTALAFATPLGVIALVGFGAVAAMGGIAAFQAAQGSAAAPEKSSGGSG